jgi:hypothetical protein
MKSPTNKGDDRRKVERRATADRRSEPARSVAGERRTPPEKRGLAKAMVDALEDILQWERASERALKVAAAHSTSDLTKN